MQSTRIIAAVANVWRQPNNTSIDTPALANVGLQPWLAQLSDEDTVALERDNRIVTQALFNDVFLVEQFVNGWAYGYVVNQADSRHPQGYPGWVWAAQLSTVPLPVQTGPMITIRRGFTPLLCLDGRTFLNLSLGTELPVISSKDHRYYTVQTPLGTGKIAKRATQLSLIHISEPTRP